MVEDTTVEALAGILEASPRGVFVARDELTRWVRGMDQYRSGGQGNDRQFWISAWANTYASVDRKNNPEPIILLHPFVGVFGSIQPDILPELAGGREDGFLDCFLFAFPNPIRTRYSEAEITPTTVGNVKWLYEKVLRLDVGLDENDEPEPTFISMSEDAKELFVSLIDSLREEMEMPGFPARLNGPWAKLEGYLARLSLIIAVCRLVATPDSVERVEQDDVLRASLLLDYFKAHARKVYVGLYGQSKENRFAEIVTLFLEEQGGEWEGEPGVFLKLLKTSTKPEHPKDLAKVLSRIARRTPALSFEPPKSVNYTKEDGTRSKKRVMKISLDFTDSAYSAYSHIKRGGENS
jgi:putative DNA primase/helicase